MSLEWLKVAFFMLCRLGDEAIFVSFQQERQKSMKNKNITAITVNSLKEIPQGKTDWKRIDSMTEEEVYQNALNDPDALIEPPLSQRKDLHPTVDVKLIRAKLSMTQQEFAKTFHLSLATLRDWEQRRVRPDQAARTLLKVIERNPNAVRNALKIA